MPDITVKVTSPTTKIVNLGNGTAALVLSDYVKHTETGILSSIVYVDTELAATGAYLTGLIQASNAGVSTINGASGILTFTGAGDIVITRQGQSFTFSGTSGGGGAGDLTQALADTLYYPRTGNPSGYVRISETGILVGENETGAFANTFVSKSETGIFDNTFVSHSETGIYANTFVAKSDTGHFIGHNETGVLSDEFVSHTETGIYTNTFVSKSETGIFDNTFVSHTETGIFDNTFVSHTETGNFVSIPYVTGVSGYLSSKIDSTGSYLYGLIQASSAGVSALNGQSGTLTLTGAGGVTVSTVGQTITVSGGSSIDTGILVGKNETGVFDNTFVSHTETGIYTNTFVQFSQTGNFSEVRVSGLLRTMVNLTGVSGIHISTGLSGVVNIGGGHLQTQINNINSNTGSFVTTAQTGIFVGKNETGIFDNTFVAHTETGIYTNTFVQFSQTGLHSEVRITGSQRTLVNLTGLSGIHISTGLSGIVNVDGGNLSSRIESTGSTLYGLIQASSAGVSALNGRSGTLTLTGAGNVTISITGQTFTISGNTGSLASTGYVSSVSGVINNRLEATGAYLTGLITQLNSLTGEITLSGAGGIIITSTGNNIVISGSGLTPGDYVLRSETGIYSNTFPTHVQTGNLLVGKNQTGNFSEVRVTGLQRTMVNLTGVSGVHVATGLSGIVVIGGGGLQLQINSINSGTGSFVTTAQTGILVGKNETGIFDNTFVSHVETGIYTNTFVQFSQTGNLSEIRVSGLQRTLVNLTGVSGIHIATGLSGIVTIDGGNLQTQINSINSNTGSFITSAQTGNFASISYVTGVSGILDSKISSTGSFLYGLIQASSAGVSSLNGQSGSLTLTGAGNVTVTVNGQALTISGAGSTGDYVLRSETGIYTGTFVSRNETGIFDNTFVSHVETGIYTNTFPTHVQTGDLLVGKNQTGILVGKNETGIFDNTFVSHGETGNFTDINYVTNVSGVLSNRLVSTGSFLLAQITGSVAGVSSVNLITGAVSITGAGSVTVTNNGQIITISGSPTSGGSVGETVSGRMFQKSMYLEYPNHSENIGWFYNKEGISLHSIVSVVSGTGASLGWTLSQSTGRHQNGSLIVSGYTDSTTSGNLVTGFSNSTISGDVWVLFKSQVTGGTISEFSMTLVGEPILLSSSGFVTTEETGILVGKNETGIYTNTFITHTQSGNLLVGRNQTGIFDNTFVSHSETGDFYPRSNPSGYIQSSETGVYTNTFVSKSETGIFDNTFVSHIESGALTGAFYPRTGNPSGFVYSTETGAYTNTFVLKTETGIFDNTFVSHSETGIYTNTFSTHVQTGDLLVGKNQTGILVGKNETGIFDNTFVSHNETGNFASITYVNDTSGILSSRLVSTGSFLLSQLTGSSAGVSSVNLITGAVSLTGAGSVVVTNNGQVITISGAPSSGEQSVASGKMFQKSIYLEYPIHSENIGWFYNKESIALHSIVSVVSGTGASLGWTLSQSTGRHLDGSLIVSGYTDSTTSGNLITSFNNSILSGEVWTLFRSQTTGGTISEFSLTLVGEAIAISTTDTGYLTHDQTGNFVGKNQTGIFDNTFVAHTETGIYTNSFYPLNSNPSGYQSFKEVKSITVESPVSGDIIPMYYNPNMRIVTGIVSVILATGGSPSVTFNITQSTGRNTPRHSILGQTVCSNETTGLFSSGFANNIVSGNSYIFYECTGASNVRNFHVSLLF
jgi:hypothetical protein